MTSARNQARAAGDTVMALNAEGFPGNGTVLENARQSLAQARHDLAAARQDAAEVLAILRAGRAGGEG